MTNDGGKTASCSIEVVGYSYEYVDLGLPSGLKWATCNLGANSPEEYGDNFAWGETETKSDFYWSTYKWCDGSSKTLTKYNNNSDYGTVDNKSILEASDDVAHVKLGGKWRMPTEEEWRELINNCTWTWTSLNGVNGRLATSKKNGVSLFFPAAGYKYSLGFKQEGVWGHYWSSSAKPNSSNAYSMAFYSDNYGIASVSGRYCGLSVRPVSE